MKANNPIKVLIADDDHVSSRRLADYISARGFEARLVNNGSDARAQIREWKPRFILADLVLPDGNALTLIDFIKNEKSLRHHIMHTIVISGHNDPANVKLALSQGAKDYVVKPFRYEDLVKRLIFHSRGYRQLEDIAKKDYVRVDDASLMLHLTDLVLRQALKGVSMEEVLFNLTRMVNLKVDGVRCSVVQCVDQKFGYVVISNDNRNVTGFQLDLYNYPEVIHVMNTQNLIAIENLQDNLELRHVQEKVRDIAFNSMIVCPVSRLGVPFGVLSLRMPPEKQTVSDNEIRFVEIVSHVVSLVLSNQLYNESEDFWMKDKNEGTLPFPSRRTKNS